MYKNVELEPLKIIVFVKTGCNNEALPGVLGNREKKDINLRGQF